MPDDWLPVTPVAGERLFLEPLRVEHAAEMAGLLDDSQLHTFIGGEPATVAELRSRYAKQIVGHSADGAHRWLTWVARRHDDAQPVGFVQATVSHEDGQPYADVAWVIGTAYQRRGYAQETAQLMVDWLRENGIGTVVAHIHPDHHASSAVARWIGLAPNRDLVDGEVRWQVNSPVGTGACRERVDRHVTGRFLPGPARPDAEGTLEADREEGPGPVRQSAVSAVRPCDDCAGRRGDRQ